jgi:hypothetical protein
MSINTCSSSSSSRLARHISKKKMVCACLGLALFAKAAAAALAAACHGLVSATTLRGHIWAAGAQEALRGRTACSQ